MSQCLGVIFVPFILKNFQRPCLTLVVCWRADLKLSFPLPITL